MCMITMICRLASMNERDVVNKMISFIEEKERQLQLNKLTADQAKSDIVKSILDELERVSADENQ